MDNEFWNSAESSNMDKPTIEFTINGKKIKAWDGASLGFDEDYYAECEDNHDYNTRDYCDLLDYMCDELGASQPRNVVALAVDLAKYNNMTMAELFTTYQKG